MGEGPKFNDFKTSKNNIFCCYTSISNDHHINHFNIASQKPGPPFYRDFIYLLLLSSQPSQFVKKTGPLLSALQIKCLISPFIVQVERNEKDVSPQTLKLI